MVQVPTESHGKRRGRGFSLVEIAMVLAIAALIIAGVMLFFGAANTSQKTTDAMQELAALQQTVHSLYGGQPTYAGLTNTVMTGSNQLANKWVSGTNVVSAFGAVTVVTDVTNTDNFDITYASLPGQVCQKMSTSDLGTGLVKVTAGSQSATNAPLTVAYAQTGCATSGNANTITWIFR